MKSMARSGWISLGALLLYLAILHPFGLIEIPKLKSQDLLMIARSGLAPSSRLADEMFLIFVDDESIKKTREAWPFPRRVYADLLNKMNQRAPRVVAFDFVFSGETNPVDDFALSRAIEASGRVVLASFVDPEGRFFLPLDELRSAARGFGFVNKLLDPDLRVRRAQFSYQNQQRRSVGQPWELEILAALGGLRPEQLETKKGGVLIPYEGARQPLFIPLDEGKVAINYRFRFRDCQRLSFWQALGDPDLAAKVEGKIVLVGAVSDVLHDSYDTPLGLMPGVVVNMNLLSDLLTHEFLRASPLVFDSLFLVLFVFLAALAGLEAGITFGLVLMGMITTAFGTAFFILLLNHYVGDSFTPFLGGWATFLLITLARYFRLFSENILLRARAVTDPLTGLANRRALESRIEEELSKLAGTKKGRKTDPVFELSALMIDVDNFKAINDRLGHLAGDEVLKKVSFSIKGNTRADDFIARFGGEEFCVLLPHTRKEEAYQIAEKIRETVEGRKWSYGDFGDTLTVSVGVASAKADNLMASRALIRAADLALYQAKQTGKNKVMLYQER